MTSIARFVAIAVLLLTGCNPTQWPPCAAGTDDPMLVYQLYFGRTVHANGFVSDADWKTFRDTVITPNLPDGYTIIDADGAWAAPGGHATRSDPTKVLIVAMPNTTASLAPIERIRSAYRAQFAQQSVGMIVQPACARF